MKVEQMALRWFAERQFSPATLNTYGHTVRRLGRRYPIDVNRFTTDHLVDFLTHDDDGAPTRRGPRTRQQERATLRSLFKWGHRRGLLRTDPAAPLDELSFGRGRRRGGRWLTRLEAVDLLATIPDDTLEGQRDRCLITVALLTGLRLGHS